MAIIRKPLLPIKGRYGGVVFYRLPCGLICRELKPHTRKRILKDPRFREFRKCSKLMARASKIGSAVYKALPEEFREFWMYRSFVGEAMKMLKDKGMTGQQALESLFKTYVEVWYIKAAIKEAESNEAEKCITTIPVKKNSIKINIRWRGYNHPGCAQNHEAALKPHALLHLPASHPSRFFGTGPPVT